MNNDNIIHIKKEKNIVSTDKEIKFFRNFIQSPFDAFVDQCLQLLQR